VYFDYDEYFFNETTTARCGGQPMTDLYSSSGPARGANASFTCSQAAQANCTYSDDIFADAAVAAIAEAGRSGESLFLFWAPHAPHDPYECPDAKLAQFPGIAQQPRHFYTAMTSVLDDNSGRVRAALVAAGLWNSTLWVMSSDNGGPIGPGYGGNNNPLKGGKASNLEGGVRVNAFATGGWLPESVRGTTVSEGLIGIEDWYTTFCALAGVDPTDAAAAAAGLPPVDGLDVSALLLAPGAASPRAEVVLGTSLGEKITENGAASVQGVLRADGWKLLIGELSSAFWQGPVYPNASGYPSKSQACGDPALPAGAPGHGPGCLYNVFSDPTEQHDLAAQEPDIVAEIRARIAAHNATVFSPHRGEDDGAACAARASSGFWGPFL
jgi:arylsulfatase I/J